MDKTLLAAALLSSTIPTGHTPDLDIKTPDYVVPAIDEDNLDDTPLTGDSSIQDEHSSEPFTDALLEDAELQELKTIFAPDPLRPFVIASSAASELIVANDPAFCSSFPTYLETLDTVSTPQAAVFSSRKREPQVLPDLIGPIETIHFDDPGLFETIYIF